MQFIPEVKAEFWAAVTPVFSPSEVILIYWLVSQNVVLFIISSVEKNCSVSYFCGNRDPFFLPCGFIILPINTMVPLWQLTPYRKDNALKITIFVYDIFL